MAKELTITQLIKDLYSLPFAEEIINLRLLGNDYEKSF